MKLWIEKKKYGRLQLEGRNIFFHESDLLFPASQIKSKMKVKVQIVSSLNVKKQIFEERAIYIDEYEADSSSSVDSVKSMEEVSKKFASKLELNDVKREIVRVDKKVDTNLETLMSMHADQTKANSASFTQVMAMLHEIKDSKL